MAPPIRRALGRLLSPVIRFVLNRIDLGDPWAESNLAIPPRRFGSGSRNAFHWYFEGDSQVTVASVEEVFAWLRLCEYESDPSLFNERDFWQHPRTFEKLRRGDCEDHAIWAWRKLSELGVEARLVVGRYAGSRSAHAWVLFYQGDGVIVFDAVVKEETRALRPLNECRKDLEPWFSVNAKFVTTSHWGYLYWMREQLNAGTWGDAQPTPARTTSA